MIRTRDDLLPADAERALLLGRVWRHDTRGPAMVAVREGTLVDLCAHAASIPQWIFGVGALLRHLRRTEAGSRMHN